MNTCKYKKGRQKGIFVNNWKQFYQPASQPANQDAPPPGYAMPDIMQKKNKSC